jgi:hypothetical protein
MLTLNMFTYKLFYEKKSLQDIILVQMYEMKIQMHFQSNYFIFLLIFLIDVYILEKYFKMIFFFFIWTKYEKYNNGQNWVLLCATKDDLR